MRFISTPAGKLTITESLQGKPNSHHETIHLTDKTLGRARDRAGSMAEDVTEGEVWAMAR